MAELRIDAVQLRVETETGNFGRTVRFGDGLNILRGANNRGKTQVVQAVIYGLGLERMLNARANAPLGSALTTEIIDGEMADLPSAVVRSWVEVQVSNRSGNSISVRRPVVDSGRQRDLVTLWSGPHITDGDTGGGEDLFLHQPGSASRDFGFHKRLEDFVGWTLPRVATFDGKESTLYVDALFPFMIVDQQGWATVAPRKLNRYQIKDVTRKGVEFLLALEGPLAEARRNQLEGELSGSISRWTSTLNSIQTLANNVGGRLIGVGPSPAGSRRGGHDIEPSDLDGLELEVVSGQNWVKATEYIHQLDGELQALLQRETPKTDEQLDLYTRERLLDTEKAIDDVLVGLRLIQQDVGLTEARLAALDSRVTTIQEERLRNVDLRTLERLGSEIEADHLSHHSCPTCRQSLDGVESERPETILGIDETVQLLNAQLLTTQKMRDRTQASYTQLAEAEAGLSRRLDALRVELRSLRADQKSASGFSQGDIARRITTEIHRAEILRVSNSVDDARPALEVEAASIARVRNEINSLNDSAPEVDGLRLTSVSSRVQTLLSSWGFGSYSESKIQLDPDELVPSRDGFDVNVDVSASDVVRVKIAYLESMREIGMTVGNHPGLLILDEPRQQDMQAKDFEQILRTIQAFDSGQVIVSTSTPFDELTSMLPDLPSVAITDVGSTRLLERLDD